MSHFEFIIPIQRDDLLDAGTSGGYSVRQVYDPADLRNSVHGKLAVFPSAHPSLLNTRHDLCAHLWHMWMHDFFTCVVSGFMVANDGSQMLNRQYAFIKLDMMWGTEVGTFSELFVIFRSCIGLVHRQRRICAGQIWRPLQRHRTLLIAENRRPRANMGNCQQRYACFVRSRFVMYKCSNHYIQGLSEWMHFLNRLYLL